MSRTRSNRVESWVEQGRIMSQTESNHESNTVEQGQIVKADTSSNTKKNHLGPQLLGQL